MKRKGDVEDNWEIGFNNDGLFFGFVFLWDMVGRTENLQGEKFLVDRRGRSNSWQSALIRTGVVTLKHVPKQEDVSSSVHRLDVRSALPEPANSTRTL